MAGWVQRRERRKGANWKFGGISRNVAEFSNVYFCRLPQNWKHFQVKIRLSSTTDLPAVVPLSEIYGHCVQLRIRYLRFLHYGWSMNCCSYVHISVMYTVHPQRRDLRFHYYGWSISCCSYIRNVHCAAPDKIAKLSPLRLIYQLLFLYLWCTLYIPKEEI